MAQQITCLVQCLEGHRPAITSDGKVSLSGISDASLVWMKGLPPLNLPTQVDGFLDVYLAHHIQPNTAYIQLKNCYDDIIALSKLLKNPFAQFPRKVIINPKQGQLCLAMFHDKNWYRAAILTRPDPKSVLVYFIDYGNTERMSKNDIYAAGGEILKYPPQAVKLVLSGVAEMNSRLLQQFIMETRELVATISGQNSDNDFTGCLMVETEQREYVYLNAVFNNRSVNIPKLAPVLPPKILENVDELTIDTKDVNEGRERIAGQNERRGSSSQGTGFSSGRMNRDTNEGKFGGANVSDSLGGGGGFGGSRPGVKNDGGFSGRSSSMNSNEGSGFGGGGGGFGGRSGSGNGHQTQQFGTASRGGTSSRGGFGGSRGRGGRSEGNDRSLYPPSTGTNAQSGFGSSGNGFGSSANKAQTGGFGGGFGGNQNNSQLGAGLASDRQGGGFGGNVPPRFGGSAEPNNKPNQGGLWIANSGASVPPASEKSSNAFSASKTADVEVASQKVASDLAPPPGFEIPQDTVIKNEVRAVDSSEAAIFKVKQHVDDEENEKADEDYRKLDEKMKQQKATGDEEDNQQVVSAAGEADDEPKIYSVVSKVVTEISDKIGLEELEILRGETKSESEKVSNEEEKEIVDKDVKQVDETSSVKNSELSVAEVDKHAEETPAGQVVKDDNQIAEESEIEKSSIKLVTIMKEESECSEKLPIVSPAGVQSKTEVDWIKKSSNEQEELEFGVEVEVNVVSYINPNLFFISTPQWTDKYNDLNDKILSIQMKVLENPKVGDRCVTSLEDDPDMAMWGRCEVLGVSESGVRLLSVDSGDTIIKQKHELFEMTDSDLLDAPVSVALACVEDGKTDFLESDEEQWMEVLFVEEPTAVVLTKVTIDETAFKYSLKFIDESIAAKIESLKKRGNGKDADKALIKIKDENKDESKDGNADEVKPERAVNEVKPEQVVAVE